MNILHTPATKITSRARWHSCRVSREYELTSADWLMGTDIKEYLLGSCYDADTERVQMIIRFKYFHEEFKQ